ncbi:receptor tyrosine-protein kinase erbB-4 [Ceratobasidium sp. AG-Ba]|nr:receptor tyrosine-protein kinase erbB-4 [Ceratobasidium sp. AG-Ba]
MNSSLSEGDDITPAISVAATTITSTMDIDEVMQHLVGHGCKDVTNELDISQLSSNQPVAWGGFGAVFHSQFLGGGPAIAIKYFLKLDGPDATNVRKILKRAAREVYAWSKCDHPNILPLYGIARIGERLALVSPWMKHGSLSGLLRADAALDRLHLCLQVASALEYIHSREIVHGDIKPENILMYDYNTPLLTDFGNAKFPCDPTLRFTATSSSSSTLRYTAPEILKGDSIHTKEADVYAYGMTAFEVLTGEVPFADKSSLATVFPVVMGKTPDRKKLLLDNSALSDRLWGLLMRCWAYEPEVRPSAAELNRELTLFSQGAS